MAPDLNSLPPSRSTSQSLRRPRATPSSPADTSSPTSPSHVRVSPAIMPYAQTQTQSSSQSQSPRHRSSPHVERRRSSLLVGEWSLDAPPGTADPHHQRAPSLGELHQELENEQEAQVNRLLGMIRQQQAQLAQYQAASQATAASQQHAQQEATSTAQTLTERPRSTSQRSPSTVSHPRDPLTNLSRSYRAEISPSAQRRRRSSSRRSGHVSNVTGGIVNGGASGAVSTSTSPALRPTSYSSNGWAGDEHARDEVALLQAEAAMVLRENQMLKMRIRELERMVRSRGEEGEEGAERGRRVESAAG